ncbi:hypothetical protein CUMW_075160, partial [Citrus unshiu]
MTTRTNFYKNPSSAYKKDISLYSVLQNLRAYNIATGNASPIEERPPPEDRNPRVKRRRFSKPQPDSCSNPEDEGKDGPIKEVSSNQSYSEELTADVLITSSSVINLVGYDSDDNDSPECKEREDPLNSDNISEVESIKSRSEQRYPVAGEPVCVVCGKYGEYICNETDDDICSPECKAELLKNLKPVEGSSRNENSDVSSSTYEVAPPVPEFGKDFCVYNCNQWSKTISSLCTYECWKCKRPGHLAKDCLVMTSSQEAMGQKKSTSISRDLLQLYRRCHQVGKSLSAANCSACRGSLNLATCLDCSAVFCDNAGHLNEHIKGHSSHKKYFSHKLKRLVKCCKSTCKVTDITDLMACHYCFSKTFDKFYDMYTTTWKGAGLSIIWNSICCEDHFEWHRMNCLNADVEDKAYIISRSNRKDKQVQIILLLYGMDYNITLNLPPYNWRMA